MRKEKGYNIEDLFLNDKVIPRGLSTFWLKKKEPNT